MQPTADLFKKILGGIYANKLWTDPMVFVIIRDAVA